MIQYELNKAYSNLFDLIVSNFDAQGILEFSRNGGELHLYFKSPTNIEIDNIQKGHI